MEHIKKYNLFEASKYIGSCVDVGSNSTNRICDYFPDATTMAQYVGNPDEDDLGRSKEITQEQFFQELKTIKSFPKIATAAGTKYYYIAYDSSRRELALTDAALFFTYNPKTDIHYFFERKK